MGLTILTGKQKVTSLKEGAEKFGGATKVGTLNYSYTKYHDNKSNIHVPKDILVTFYVPYKEVGCFADEMKLFRSIIGTKPLLLSCTEATGSWIMDSGEYVEEPVMLVQFILHDAVIEDIYRMVSIADKLKRELNQESVAFELDDKCMVIVG